MPPCNEVKGFLLDTDHIKIPKPKQKPPSTVDCSREVPDEHAKKDFLTSVLLSTEVQNRRGDWGGSEAKSIGRRW